MAVSFQTFISILCISAGIHSIMAYKITLKKCCPFKSYVNESSECERVGSNLDFTDLKVYDSDLQLTDRRVKDVFEFKAGIFDLDKDFKDSAIDFVNLPFNFNMYLVETGDLHMESPNDWDRWRIVNSTNFCVDYLITANQTPTPHFWAFLQEEEGPPERDPPRYVTYGMLISCVFLALVLAVYSLLSELRNLKGLILMAYVASLFIALLLLAVMQLMDVASSMECQVLSYFIYFGLLAGFCWMNVMSFDIWWTIRTKDRERFKFRAYCAYAFGVPLAMTAFFVAANLAPMRRLPWFVTPKVPEKGCFLSGYAKFLYLYVPMLVLILLNWTFFLMTSFELWSHHRATTVLDTAGAGPRHAHRQHRARLLVYLKLSLIMGINWLLEVVSSFSPALPLWIVSDLYNVLIGLSIFLIFVCDRSTLRKLKKRFRNIRGGTAGAAVTGTTQSSHTMTSDDGSHEPALLMCPHPDEK